MPRRLHSFILLSLLGLAALAWPGQQSQSASPAAPEKVSRFGQYSGYSPVLYNSSVRTSVYLTMRDGVRIAIDILRPARDGKAVDDKFPVVWTHNRYRRAFKVKDRLITIADSPDIRNLIMHGYVAASADVRGSGASFGAAKGMLTREESQDAYEITEWLARQPWSDGKVGMFGGSYLGMTQLMAAGTNPPHLKAIFPVVSLFDLYEVVSQGGIFKHSFAGKWTEMTYRLDTEPGVEPVDADRDGALLKKALEGHKSGNSRLGRTMGELKFRDAVDSVSAEAPYLAWQPAARLAEINASAVPMYLWGGWFDSFTRHAFLAYRNFTAPRRLVVGAWSHSPKDPEIVQEEFRLLAVEEHRWFDRWLKGIDNGIMNEPPILYQVMVAPKKNIWKTAAAWPPSEAKAASYYLAAGRSLTSASLNDGKLLPGEPKKAGQDDYPVDYSATTGTSTRWDNAVGGGFGYPDLGPNDAKGLTYTSPALKAEVEVTGTAVVHVWLSSTAADADLFAYLEEVDAQNVSRYVTEGALRASLRSLGEAPYDNLGWPYHRAFAADAAPLKPGEPVELVLAMEPTSNVFEAGNRIRLTLTCADKDNAATPRLDPPPTVTVYRAPGRTSFLSLPFAAAPVAAPAPASFYIYFVLGLVLVLAVAFAFYFRSRVGKKA